MRGAHRTALTGAGAGWRALADAVADALTDLLTGPVAATDGPQGVLIARVSTRHAGAPLRQHAGGASLLSTPRRRHSKPSDPEPEPSPTWALVERAQAGDGDAFGELYDHYVDSVYRFIYYRVHDRGLAEDLTSETFLRALRRITSVEYQGRDIGAWFMTIARNLVFDHSKSARARLEVVTGDELDPGTDVISTEATVLAGITTQQLVAAVNQLGEEQRECIVLRFIQGMSVNETAEIMGKRDGAIKALQHRAVKRLATLLADELGDGSDLDAEPPAAPGSAPAAPRKPRTKPRPPQPTVGTAPAGPERV